jgi:hypothetical protein
VTYSPPHCWQVIRKSTGEPLFPEPVWSRSAAVVLINAYLRMDMLRDPKTDTVSYTMRTDAQVQALLARDYKFIKYKLVETRAK